MMLAPKEIVASGANHIDAQMSSPTHSDTPRHMRINETPGAREGASIEARFLDKY
jgi:hypothetical protein